MATVAGPGRLVAMETGAEQAYLLAFSDFQVKIFRNGVLRTTVATPWSESQVAEIAWAQRKQSLLVTHPDVRPQQLTRATDTVWTIGPWQFAEIVGPPTITLEPFTRFADPNVTVQSSAASGTVTITTSAPVFIAEHLGGIVRIKGKQIQLTNIQSSTQAIGLVLQTLDDGDPLTTDDAGPTTDWDELAFSDARGWPVSVSFHQDRMVIGGSRDLPNGLWLSKTGDHFNFDLGDGLDDEAIAFRLVANDDPAIRSLMPDRQLQVFTSVGEWVLTGEPLTPTNIQVQQQSRIGSPRDRQVPPRDVDGATLFAARSGREIREFLFVDTEQAYQAADLALLARHLVQFPIDQDFDQARRLFLIAMADGSLASIAIYRIADVAAWSRQETDGSFLSVATAGGQTFVLVERANGVFIEQLDDSLMVDSGLRLSAPVPTLVWDGVDHLEGQTVALIADGIVVEQALVTGGQVTLAHPASELTLGLPFAHVIEPLPAVLAPGRGVGQAPSYRPVRVTLRLFETQSLRIDTGDGLREVALHTLGGGPKDRAPSPFTGDLSLRALGWRRGAELPPWRIEQATPLPCALLSATTEVKVNS
ncbi:MAG TPA: hypothetical protein VLE23_13625 [Geminicoccaceae bacterium]|nr:hypothetical protein [Geminicoccaceae bacterium]